MQEARILHCEDSKEMRESVAEILAIRGVHRLVSVAESVAEAQERLEDIARRRLDANVILLDGHLRDGAAMNHPRVIKVMADELGLRIPIIGLSADGLAEKGLVVRADIVADITKLSLAADTEMLDRILDELPEPEHF